MSKIQSVAAVLTCFNRRKKTAACLATLADQATRLAEGCSLNVIVVDDGSTDGTREMLAIDYPNVKVIFGDGTLFWAGGMRKAFGHALTEAHDFYIWINDDVELFDNCLRTLLDTHQILQQTHKRGGIVIGSTCDTSGNFSYGGLIRAGNSGFIRRYEQLPPSARPLPCVTMNGNCVLISSDAAKMLGNIDTAFRHGIADFDYGLRATQVGVPIWIMPGYAGLCTHDHLVEGSYLDRTLPLAVRWRKITSPKGLAPYAWFTYCRRHTGWVWPLHYAWPYVKVLVSWFTYRLYPFTRTED